MKKSTLYTIAITLFLMFSNSIAFTQTVGKLYGGTQNGGKYNDGVLFCFDPSTGKDSILVNFNDTNGSAPQQSLMLASDGYLYGTTGWGGKSDNGTMFKCTTSGALTTLINFNDTNGAEPLANVIQATDGNFYATTATGGNSSSTGTGTFFKYSGGKMTTIETLYNYIGEDPYFIIEAKDSNIYGAIEYGGPNNRGALFKYTLSGSFSILYTFTSQQGVVVSLIQGFDGNFYGTGQNGGCGSIFKYDLTAGNLTTLYTFKDSADGCLPATGLIQASDSNLYGMDHEGVSEKYGTIFKCTTSGVFTTLFDFNGTDGYGPFGGLIEGSDGNLYGMTEYGGTSLGKGAGGYGYGTLFKCTKAGVLTTLLNLDSTTGINPFLGSLLEIKSQVQGINEVLSYINVNLYPNPSNGLITVESNISNEKLKIEIYNVLGEDIYKNTLSQSKTQLNLTNQPSGIYLYKIYSSKGNYMTSGKFIIE